MADAIVLTWTGDEALVARLLKAAAGSVPILAQAVYETASEIFNESQELVPVQFGTLRSSGFVSTPEISGGDVEVQIGYGGAASEYAVIVHEDLTMQHPRGGQAKYLESPAVAGIETFGARVALRAQALLGGV